MGVYLQDPDSKLDWQHDWTGWISDGDSIASRQWTIYDGPTAATGVTLVNSTSAAVTVPKSSLTAGKIYRLTEHIVTANGLEYDQSIIIRCAQS